MKKHIKTAAAFALVISLIFSFAACSDKKEKEDTSTTNEEIDSKYEDIANDYLADKPIGSDSSVFETGLSTIDFTFTSPDAMLAFSLDKNSFVSMVPSGTFYSYLAPGSETTSYPAGYKTARGMSLSDNAVDIVNKYGIGDKNALYKKTDSDIYYNPTSGSFDGKLTAIFASTDSVSYSLLSSDQVQKFLSVWEAVSQQNHIEPQKILELFPDFTSVVSLNVTSDTSGNVSEIMIAKFDK